MSNADPKELTELSDEMKAAIGRSGPAVTYEVSGQGIRTFARAVGYGNPIYYSEEAAQARGYVALPAPPGFLGMPVFDPSAPAARRPAFASPFKRGLNGGTEVEEGTELVLNEEMTRQRLVIWAAASRDFYPIHYDDGFAPSNRAPTSTWA